ncbi:hypothetical protein RRG08_064273 [Elysia crispata]|uniref:Chitin-binding type-2 domain-containing protein n=1 Tax=Elysia crispata TaxID=231223 RepID=A0AAE0YNF0_9GAST|nr:hypothetical protein RRG08_064273 [Elysia crispata]
MFNFRNPQWTNLGLRQIQRQARVEWLGLQRAAISGRLRERRQPIPCVTRSLDKTVHNLRSFALRTRTTTTTTTKATNSTTTMNPSLVQILTFSLALMAVSNASPRVRRNPHAAKNRCPQGPNPSDFLYADPDDCSQYFSCSHGVNIPMPCPVGLHFSNTLQFCTYPDSIFDTCGRTTASPVSTSSSAPSPAPSSSSAPSTAPNSNSVQASPNPHAAKNQCPQGPTPPTHLYADPDDCSKFFMCSNGVNILMSCPADLHFSNRKQTCVHRGDVDDTCEIDQAVKKCQDGYQGIIPHPIVCQRYFNCSNDLSQRFLSPYLPFENECRYPEVFDSVSNQCMSHKNATCSGISRPFKYFCDYLYTRCPRSHCIPCSLAANCVGLPDGYHVHSAKGYPVFARCEDEYAMEELVCPPPRRIDETLRSCVV